MTVESFERALMAGLLAGDDPELAALREQYEVAIVKDREMTESGFVTWFDIPSSAAPIERKLLHLDDLQVELEGADTPVDVSLEVHKGRLHKLECFVYEGLFPESPVIRAAWYYGTEKHDGITPELMAERDVDELLDEDDE
ncbi:MAG TPA: hypothetical protein VJZ00_18435 [Thermoanaerobaculia bacterium]|nr:hypothetical protein [Thermoanaerobaculia bacterium]